MSRTMTATPATPAMQAEHLALVLQSRRATPTAVIAHTIRRLMAVRRDRR